MQGHRHSTVMPLHIFLVAGAPRPAPVAIASGEPNALRRSRRRAPLDRAARDEREPQMDSFGSRLRYERERRQIALKSIAESTKISVALLEGLERDDVSRWPSGIFRKSFIRSYAEAVGLPSEPIVREFVERYPDPLETDVSAPPAITRAVQQAPGPIESPHSPSPRSASSEGPLAIKLTITWSGSVHHTIGRLADWKIVRMLRDRRLMLPASPHESEGAVQGQVPPV